MATKRTSAAAVIAATFGWDSRELSEYRYQPTRTKQSIYNIEDAYYAASVDKPKDEVGEPWELYKDQFFAQRYGTKLWESKVSAR